MKAALSKLKLLAMLLLAATLTFSCGRHESEPDPDSIGADGGSSSSAAEAGPSSGSASNDDDTPRFINKYVAEPYTGPLRDKIKYSYSYEGYDVYYIHLGELKNVPVFYLDAEYFGTVAEQKITFKTTTTETNQVKEAVSRNSQTTTSVVDQYTKSSTVGVKASQEISATTSAKTGGLTAALFGNASVSVTGKLGFEESWSQYVSNSATTGFQETTSLTNTTEYISTNTKTEELTFEWFFSKANGDRAGWYRRTLFYPCDVYLYVVKDSKGVIYYEFREYVIPGPRGWALDYSETLSFEKSDATSFEFDVSVLDYLPKPSLSLDLPAPESVSASAQDTSSINVSWSPVSNINYYEIYRSASENGMYEYIKTSSSTSYTDTELSQATTYYYKIIAVNGNGSSVLSSHASATTKKLATIKEEFTAAGEHAYAFDKGFPATIEVYALGAGGGGQGGNESVVFGATNKGTGGSGGGGAAAYMKFSAENLIAFDITVGKGGAGGSNVKKSITETWASGSPGAAGGSTSVIAGSTTLTVEGGGGAGGGGQVMTAGIGGRKPALPANLLDSASEPGKYGNDGKHKADLRNTNLGGDAAEIKIGSENSFGGGLGARKNVKAQAGGGGIGGYSGDNGTAGGDGKVVIVVTYFE